MSLRHTSLVLATFLFAFLLLSVEETEGATRRSHCSESLPTSLSRVILERFPDWQIKSRKHSKHGCPGTTKVDLYGDGRLVYGIVIRRQVESRKTIDEKLVLAEKNGRAWKVSILLEEAEVGNVWHAPAGRYGDMYSTMSIRSKGDVINYFWHESSSIIYAWTGEKIEEVLESD